MLRFVCAMVLGLSLAAGLQAAEWGTLKGQFVYDGEAPAPETITPTTDPEVCSTHPLVKEDLVVGADGGLANVVIFVRTEKGDKLEVHPDYAATASDKVVLDNKNCRFDPHVAGMRVSQTLTLGNSDPMGHNTKGEPFANPGFNQIIGVGSSVDHKFKLPETLPVKVSCNIHPWMGGWVVVRPDPYFAISAADGTFEIKNLPAGELEFQVWHERGYPSQVNLDGKDTKWLRGRFKFTVKPGDDNNLGVIKVDPTVLKKKT